MTLTRLAHAIVLAWGWRRALIAFVAGAASALALAPFNAWPILFLTFPVLVWLIDGSAAGRWAAPWPRRSPAGGSASAISSPDFTGSATPSWSMPRPSAGCCRSRSPACRPISRSTPPSAVAAARLIWVRGPERVLALAAALTVAEWLRGHLLSGFPWNTFGYALTEPLALAQSASLVGIWGLTFLSIAICASPAVLADDAADTPHPRRAPAHRRPDPGRRSPAMALCGYGSIRPLT